MNLIRNELKIMGINPLLISAALVIVFTGLALVGGKLLNLSLLGFEVIYPFFAAIAVGEWGRTGADENFDLIAAQGKSLFAWVLRRVTAVFITVSLFAAVSMVFVSFIRHEMPAWEMGIIYLAPAFFLATLAVLLDLLIAQEHIATLICGVVWLIAMLTRSLMRFTVIGYFYLFIRFSGDTNHIWLANKAALLAFSLVLWGVIYLICRKRQVKLLSHE